MSNNHLDYYDPSSHSCIHITQNTHENTNIPVWEIIELQGVVEPRPKTASLSGANLGQLVVGEEKCQLEMEGHILSGKRVALRKPLLVTKKHSDGDFHIQAVVTHKLLFSDRPQPKPKGSPRDKSKERRISL